MKSKTKGMYHLKIKLMIRTILLPPRNMSANCEVRQSCKIKERRGIAWLLLAGVYKLRGIRGKRKEKVRKVVSYVWEYQTYITGMSRNKTRHAIFLSRNND